MEVFIKEYKEYNESEILKLYQSVGWTNYVNNPEMLKNAYENSLKIYAAYMNDKMAGIIRVVGDGFSVVFIRSINARVSGRHCLKRFYQSTRMYIRNIYLPTIQKRLFNFISLLDLQWIQIWGVGHFHSIELCKSNDASREIHKQIGLA